MKKSFSGAVIGKLCSLLWSLHSLYLLLKHTNAPITPAITTNPAPIHHYSNKPTPTLTTSLHTPQRKKIQLELRVEGRWWEGRKLFSHTEAEIRRFGVR